MNPTAHTAKPAVAPETGRFASLGALHRAPGSRAPARGPIAAPFVARSLIALCALVGAFAFASVAQAEPPKLIPYGQFATHQFRAAGVAVEGSGDLFLSSLYGERYAHSPVVKLDPSGNLLSPPGPFGSEWYSGVAVNPVNGDVYVLGQEGSSLFTPGALKIFVYDPNTGAPVSSFEVSASRNFFGILTSVPIAADSEGNVYVPVVPENEVLEYNQSGTLLKTFTGSGASVLTEPTGVAVDSSGNLWVAGSNRIVELNPSDAPVEVNGKPVKIESEGVWSMALDGHGDVLAYVVNGADPCGAKTSPCGHLVEYNSEGRQLADVGAGKIGEFGSEEDAFSGLAANEANGRVYVVAGQQGTVWVFGPPTAPVVDRELAAEVHKSEAKLGALVHPGGIQTTYRFEYGPTSAYGSSTPHPEGSVGEGLESHAVWAAASGLAAGSTYHYRVVASNELGTVYGPDQTFTTLTAEQAACPNEQLRSGFAVGLPDCRAYELVTPPPKNSSQFNSGQENRVVPSTVAADGEAISLRTEEPQPGASSGGEQYVATRHANDWTAEDVKPLESYDAVGCQEENPVYAYSGQLTKDVMLAGAMSSASVAENIAEEWQMCNPEGRQVASGEPVGYENLLVRDNATGAYQLVNVTPPGVTPADAHFQAASADASHVIFTETSPLAQGARYGVENLYEWDEGAVRLVSWLQDGTAVPGSLAASAGTAAHEGVVSSDGSHVLFTYGGALYDRIDGQRTVQVDKNQGGSGPSGGGSFKAVTSDGSKVFFTDESKLTAGSTAAAGEPDLYECALPEGSSKCELADLTVAAGSGHADVVRVTPLGDRDSSYVYFVAKGVLASNTRQFTNSEGKTVVEGAEPGKENLYLWNGEKTVFIASGVSYTGRESNEQTSPDGKWIAFESEKGLTGYDIVEPSAEYAINELFLYNAVTEQIVCASCNPTGEAPVAKGGVARFTGGTEEGFGVFHTRHLLTDAGQVFFETRDALVPSDTNGQLDVYEYEGGHVYLISSGTSSFGSNLEGASESGDDVFFRSNQALVPQDQREGQIVIYDARVAGGFAEPSSPPACTTADSCRAAVLPQPSVYGAPASQTFSGVGNLSPPPPPAVKTTVTKSAKCKQGFAKKKGKCVKTKKSKRARKANRKGRH